MAAPSRANLKASVSRPQIFVGSEQAEQTTVSEDIATESIIAHPKLGGLDNVEIRRRWWHMSPGLVAMVLWFVPHADPISPTLYGIFMVASLAMGLHIFIRYRKIAREGDTSDRLDAVAGYVCTVLAMVLCFPGDLELALVVLAVLAFGDGSATLVGKAVQGASLPWNHDKSWAGLIAFVMVGGTMASLMYWSETQNPEALFLQPITTLHIVMSGFLPAIAGAVVESVRSPINDNVRVGLAAGITVALLQFATIGIS